MTDPIKAVDQTAQNVEAQAIGFFGRAKAWLVANWKAIVVCVACFIAGAVLF